MRRFEYVEPQSLGEALTVLSQYQGKAKVLAGGTELLPKMKIGILSPSCIVNLKWIQGLDGIDSDAKGVCIGALTRIDALQKSGLIGKSFSILSRAAGSVASKQIRNMATVGGNLCLDSRCRYYDRSQDWLQSWPRCLKRGGEVCNVRKGGECVAIVSNDLASPLMALGANLRISASNGDRLIPLHKFFTGKGDVPYDLRTGEILKEVLVPFQEPGTGTAFVKFTKRAAVDFPLIGVAVSLIRSDSDGTCSKARIVLGQASLAPTGLSTIESFLIGKRLDIEVLQMASRLVLKERIEFSNADGVASYKRGIVETIILRALNEAWDRAN